MGMVDITGQKFGRLTVDSFAYTKGGRAYWNCICDCGKRCIKMGKYLRNGDTKSCGCYNIERIKSMGKSNANRNRYEILEDGATVKVYFNNTDNYFLCDLEDWQPISDMLTWWETESGYARADLGDGYGNLLFHVYALNIKPTEYVMCDHINRNRLDNRKRNLRIVTSGINNYNQKIYKNNKTGCAGVYYRKSTNKWYAYIGVEGKQIYCGGFDTYEEAKEVKGQAELKYYGFNKDNVLVDDPIGKVVIN